MKIIASFILFIFSFNLSIAQNTESTWKTFEINETYMKKISKEQCMNKTISSLTDDCKSDVCMQNMSKTLLDCLVQSNGNALTYCLNYDLNYTKKCVENKIDGRTCYFVNYIKDLICKAPLSEVDELTKNLSPLDIFVTYGVIGEWSFDCTKKKSYAIFKASNTSLIGESYVDGKIIGRAVYADVKIVQKNTYSYTSHVYNNQGDFVRTVTGVTEIIFPNKQNKFI